MAKNTAGSGEERPIIIKKVKKISGGHHGGAWKVAYADFVTAMMAFFLLLWLLNVTTEEQKNAISDYFDPTNLKVSDSKSGAGGVMGGLSMSKEGAMTSMQQPITSPQRSGSAINANSAIKSPDGEGKYSAATEEAMKAMREEEEDRFDQTMDMIKQSIQDDPDLSALAKNLIVDMTPEGLRIQIVDAEGKSMFASGSARMFDDTHKLIGKITQIIGQLPNQISLRGHTDSVPYGSGANYTNWELSTDRANASRRVMLETGLDKDRINNVIGKAATEPLLKDDPTNARNRRISLVLLKEELTNPNFKKKAEDKVKSDAAKADEEADMGAEGDKIPLFKSKDRTHKSQLKRPPTGTFRKTQGNIQFP